MPYAELRRITSVVFFTNGQAAAFDQKGLRMLDGPVADVEAKVRAAGFTGPIVSARSWKGQNVSPS